jgi:hypothetical protein
MRDLLPIASFLLIWGGGGRASVSARRNPPAAARDNSGFTLIEVIVVLGNPTAMIGLVVGRGPLHAGRLGLDAAAREVAGSIAIIVGIVICRRREARLRFCSGPRPYVISVISIGKSSP